MGVKCKVGLNMSSDRGGGAGVKCKVGLNMSREWGSGGEM